MAILRTTLEKLAAQAKANNIHRMAEMQAQSDYVLKVLEALGWKSSDWSLGTNIGANTGTFSDILLHDSKKHPVLVVECKDAKKADKLDGRYRNQTFQEQLYGYCRKQGLYWGILTNFVEWRLYNETQGRLYQNKKYAFIDLLWPGANPNSYVDILSDEGLAFLMRFQRTPLCQAKGRVDDDPLYYPVEKQIEDIKARFFVKLKGWRDSLRRELHKNYWEKYDKDQIDLFTQKILDRMIFMEVCHDKGIIGQDVHRAILNSRDDKYHELKKWFKEMDEQFNTELFAPMAIDHFDIDDKALAPIIAELNEIDFKNVSVHIIGEVYENYLGEMLRVTKKSGLKAQEHKEQAKRKSQGIYYTPEYIVDYIVKNTVGELLNPSPSGRGAGVRSTTGAGPNPKSLPREGRDLTTAEIEKIKALDPACGSGSFLIKAFDLFLQAYRRAAAGKQTSFYSDLEIKKKILQHNLYGVDLDERAVEITKLNLMLKALEGLSYHDLKGRKLLPNLELNIRCGNSLISGQTIEQLAEKQAQTTIPGLDDAVDIKPLLKLHGEFYKEVEDDPKAKLKNEIEIEEKRLNRKLGDNLKGYFSNLDEVKPLNYQVAFPEVFTTSPRPSPGGRGCAGFDAVFGNPPYIRTMKLEKEKGFYSKRFSSAVGAYDIYVLFMERSLDLVKENGICSFITPNKYFVADYATKLRELLLNAATIFEIADLGKCKSIFGDALISTAVTFYGKKQNVKQIRLKILNDDNVSNIVNQKYDSVNIDDLLTRENTISIYQDDTSNKITDKLWLNSDKLSKVAKVRTGIMGFEYWAMDKWISDDNTGCKIATNSYIDRYAFLWGKKVNLYKRIVYIPKLNPKCDVINENTRRLFECKKILVRGVASRLTATLDDTGVGMLVAVHSVIGETYEDKYLLGLLNSKLFNWLHVMQFYSARIPEGSLRYPISFLANLPIRRIDFKNKKDKDLHDQLVKLVKEMLKLNKNPERRPLPGPPRIGEGKRADIAVIDQEIDELVYRLYGLSEEEIKIVESNNG
ncbi:Eco57I restriction-modification methylase domain-containing protein [candidate division TA06 bacterium]|uniref:site-specific DNA-methyltransferase (adenine-specific) n=1 Tax=candidate division TA06 bacterium TaxID=2250710 RepID=A0A933MIT8_UNCT6|nr:Eco57I restriction-modification methylase domain-containing protein [candidate division TA06 bacterium]